MDIDGRIIQTIREGETRRLTMFYDFNTVAGSASLAEISNPLIIPNWGELEVRAISATMAGTGVAGSLANNTTIYINVLINGDTYLFLGDSTMFINGAPIQLFAGKAGNVGLSGGQGNFPLILRPGDRIKPLVRYPTSVTTPTGRSPLYIALDCRLVRLATPQMLTH